MNGKFFLDTNIFVYSFDSRYPAKQQKAQRLIDKALADHAGLISYQVVQEFLHVALRKFEKPLSSQECRSYLDQVLSPLCDVLPSMNLFRQALEVKEESGFGFYDSLIVASAVQGGCKTLYTEDLQNGQHVAGLTIQNPFS
jgi:predicted nucleic acid-binding protein